MSEETAAAAPDEPDGPPPAAETGSPGAPAEPSTTEPPTGTGIAESPAEPGTAKSPVEPPAAPTGTSAAESPAGSSTVPAGTGAAQSPSGSPAVPAVPRRVVFRFPAASYVVIAFLALCVSFVAVASPYLLPLYLLPLGAVVWVMRTRTEVDAERLVVRTVLFRTVLPWSKVASLRLAERGWIRAVRTDGGEIALPTVRTRHLPALALISGGRLTDPTAEDS